MTSSELLLAALRRWYVVLVGAVLSLGAVYVSAQQPTVYWSQFNVLLLGPKIEEFPNYLEDPRYTLYPIVGLVVDDVNRDLNGGRPAMLTASTETNMVGQGIMHGIQVRVPNLGTQWQRVTSANYLDVQVAGATPDEVTDQAGLAVDRVAASLEERQDELGIGQGMRVTSVAAVDDPTIYPIQGSRMRAAAATGASGAAMTFVLVYALERRRTRKLARS
jgi:hypothetical protein